MIRRSSRLDELERRWEREAYQDLDFHQALERFSAMWAHAVTLGAAGVSSGPTAFDWRHDLGADLRIARAINGLPPA